MADFHIKQNDLVPEIQVTLVDEDNNDAPVDVSGATEIRFHMKRPRDKDLKVDAVATAVDAANGVVKYTWQGTDTDTAGKFEGEFEVVFAGPRPLTFPNYGYIDIRITNDLD